MKWIDKTQIMDKDALRRALTRIAYEIVERNKGVAQLCLVGIFSRGVPLAKRLSEKIKEIEGKEIPWGILDISRHRDDYPAQKPLSPTTETRIDFDISGKTVILVDDVLFTGRTTRAALDALFELGRPACVSLAVLVDRGHRELPVRPDYIGKNVPTSLKETVFVLLEETDGEDKVVIREKSAHAEPAPPEDQEEDGGRLLKR